MSLHSGSLFEPQLRYYAGAFIDSKGRVAAEVTRFQALDDDPLRATIDDPSWFAVFEFVWRVQLQQHCIGNNPGCLPSLYKSACPLLSIGIDWWANVNRPLGGSWGWRATYDHAASKECD